jgi:hypothetical protein
LALPVAAHRFPEPEFAFASEISVNFIPVSIPQWTSQLILGSLLVCAAPSTWDLQIDGKRDGLSDAGDYAAMATPVTSAQVAKAWVRPDRRLATVS